MNRVLLLLVTLLAASPLAAQPAPNVTLRDSVQVARAQQLFIQGLTRAFLDDHAQARTFYEDALRLLPDQPAVLAALAETSLALDTPTSALLYAERAVALAPDEPAYRVGLADVQVALEQWDAAIATYEALVARYPEQPVYLAELAGLQAVARRDEDAIATYSRLLDRFGDDLRVRGAMLRLYDRTGNLPAIARTLEGMLRLQPENDLAARMLADVYLRLDQPREAVRVLESLLARLPGDAETTAWLADLYHRTGRSADAAALLDDGPLSADERFYRSEAASDSDVVARLERQLEATPNDYETLRQLGELKLQVAAYREAAALLTRAVERNPREPGVWASAVTASLRSGQASEAARLADDALLLFPGQLPLLRLAAAARVETGDARDALRYVGEALHILETDEPDNLAARAELLALRGAAHHHLGEAEASDADLKAAQETAPRHAPVLNEIARTLALQPEELAQALELARKAVEREPENVIYLHTYGAILFQMGQLNEAAQVLERAVETGQAQAPTYERLGDVYAAQGNRDGARIAWKRALLDHPDNAALQEKLRKTEQ